MSSLFRIMKEVASLPTSLEKDTVYFVRAGSGFDMYVSDMTGRVAYKVNKVDSSALYSIRDSLSRVTKY